MSAHQIIRDRLKQELKQRELSAVELARNAGVKNSFIYDILNGKSTNPSIVKLAQVSEALGVTLAYLSGGTDNPHAQGSAAMSGGEHVAIPRIKVAGGSVITEKPSKHYFFRKSWIQDTLKTASDKLRLVSVTGDAMKPTLVEGDMVLVDTARTSPSPAGIFVVFDGAGLSVKRLEMAGKNTVRILSDNTQYSPFERPLADANIVGRVVWFARELL